ncbi:MAG: hypothetical protein HONDAALG_03401 [Gammaproteobacteria bacterium]|nr:hypothetical protein [Gammaproteobacteria bacterium]
MITIFANSRQIAQRVSLRVIFCIAIFGTCWLPFVVRGDVGVASRGERTSGGGGGSGENPRDEIPPAALVLDHPNRVHKMESDLTVPGTAVVITADDVTLDLNGHTITYNAEPTSTSVFGVYVAVGVDRVTITNGTILQGAGESQDSPAIFLYGASWQVGPHMIHDLVIRTVGVESGGIQADKGYSFNQSKIFRTYIEVLGDTSAIDGYGADPLSLSARNRGGIEIHDNILVGGHRGMQLIYIGADNANRSDVYKNRIQQKRRPGSKAPYGILLAGRSHNVHIYDNQIISDDGRGINVDGWGQGVEVGASGNFVYGNRIDVQYSSSATKGEYVENNVYGIRDRYSSGDNIFENNTIIAASDVRGDVIGVFVGSDDTDPLMRDITVNNNTIIARKGKIQANEPYAVQFSPADSVTVTDNKYLANGFSVGENSVGKLTLSGNNVLSTESGTPPAPKGVKVIRFLDSYLIEWSDVETKGVYEYVVYRDGKRVPMSPRGGEFFVDVGAGGAHAYAVSAMTVDGREGPRSKEMSTAEAANGWW